MNLRAEIEARVQRNHERSRAEGAAAAEQARTIVERLKARAAAGERFTTTLGMEPRRAQYRSPARAPDAPRRKAAPNPPHWQDVE